MSEIKATSTLTVYITREPWSDFFLLHIPKPDGSEYTEELDTNDTLEWFRSRGADMAMVEKGLDHVWNFYKGALEIVNYREPPVRNPEIQPKID